MNIENLKVFLKQTMLCLSVCSLFCGCSEADLPSESSNPQSEAPVITAPAISLFPSNTPSLMPTKEPVDIPTVEPTAEPVATPTVEPVATPTVEPTREPVATPTVKPTKEPVATPTVKPTVEPVATPTTKPTKEPVATPTVKPTKEPVKLPTIYKVFSPEDSTITNEDKTVTIDISNTSKGYFSIKYTGSNKKVKAIVTLGENSYTYDINKKNSYIYFPLQLGNGKYSIGVYENVSGSSYMPVLQDSFSVKIKDKNLTYLYPNQYVWFEQDSSITKLSATVCAGCKTDVEKISAIFKYVTSNISYDYAKAKTVTSGYLPNIDQILMTKKGICFDYASVFAAMCRAQGLPCKLITGYVPDNGSLAFHAWNQIYTKDKGYITVSFYIKPGFNTLDPTFYSTINNDEKAATKFGDGSQYQIYKFY